MLRSIETTVRETTTHPVLQRARVFQWISGQDAEDREPGRSVLARRTMSSIRSSIAKQGVRARGRTFDTGRSRDDAVWKQPLV